MRFLREDRWFLMFRVMADRDVCGVPKEVRDQLSELDLELSEGKDGDGWRYQAVASAPFQGASSVNTLRTASVYLVVWCCSLLHVQAGADSDSVLRGRRWHPAGCTLTRAGQEASRADGPETPSLQSDGFVSRRPPFHYNLNICTLIWRGSGSV